jgi:tape measure domain-containing protein
METELERMIVRLLGDTAQYQAAMRQAQQATDRAAHQIQGVSTQIEGLTGRMSGFAQSALSIVASLGLATTGVGFITESVRLSAELEQNTIAMEVLTGSAAQAHATIAELTQFAAETPFEMTDVIPAARMLLGFGDTAESIVPTMTMLGDVSSALGIRLQDMTYLFGTLRTQGRAFTIDIRQFAMRGIPIWQELSKVLGVNVKAVQKMVEEGKVGFAEVEQAFKNMSGAGGRFGGMMERQSTTVAGLFSTMRDNITQTMIGVGDVLIESLNLKGITQAITWVAQQSASWLKDMHPAVRRVAGAIALGTASVIALGIAIAGAGVVFNLAFGGIGIVVGTLVTGVAAITAWITTSEWYKSVGVAVWTAIWDTVKGFLDWMFPIWQALRQYLSTSWEIIKGVAS